MRMASGRVVITRLMHILSDTGLSVYLARITGPVSGFITRRVKPDLHPMAPDNDFMPLLCVLGVLCGLMSWIVIG